MRSTSLALFVVLFASSSFADLKVHEWGTFTSLLGSDGISQHGMYHEDEKLPDFVHGFGETNSPAWSGKPPPTPRPCHGKCVPMEFINSNQVTQKMETPVIYFHSDRRVNVEVNVKFPEGVISQTFPAPYETSPTPESEPLLAKGNTTFKVTVLAPDYSASKYFPRIPEGNIYGHARNVKSNAIQSRKEFEQFIFYRGLGRFQPDFYLSSENGAIEIANQSRVTKRTPKIPSAYLVHVNSKGHAIGHKIGEMAPHSYTKIDEHRIDHLISEHETDGGFYGEESLKADLIDDLVREGLNRDEAAAMINTWSHGYLKVPGLRLLYILPKGEADRILPLTIKPTPAETIRAFVGRIEILTQKEERRLITLIQRQGARFKIETLGRFAEPILRRLQQVYNKEYRPRTEGFEQLLEKLIQSASEQSPGEISGAVR